MLATAILACGEPGMTSATGTGGGGPELPLALGTFLTYGIAAFILGAGIIALVTIVALTRPPRPSPIPMPVPAGAILSPDGYYWWDGAAWRPVG